MSETQMKFRVIICGVQIIYGTVVKIKMKFRVFAKKKGFLIPILALTLITVLLHCFHFVSYFQRLVQETIKTTFLMF